MKERAFFILIFGFLLGVGLASCVGITFEISLLFILASLSFFLFSFIYQDERSTFLFISLCFFAFGLGILRFTSEEARSKTHLSDFENKLVILYGVVADEPSMRENTQGFPILVSKISLKGEKEQHALREKVLISTFVYPQCVYGDLVLVEGKLEKPKSFETKNGRLFDYESYLSKDKIFYMVSFASVKKLDTGRGNILKERLLGFKNRLLENLKNVLPEPHASLAGGVFLGGKNSLGRDLEDDFRKAGIIHIIVLSGYNIVIVAKWIMKLFSFLPRRGTFLLGFLGIILFAIMTGGTGTVVRASLMALISLLASATGKPYLAGRALFFAAFLMVIYNPKFLVFDFSFQLSFLATLGLIYLSPVLERKFSSLTRKANIREMVVTTISTQMATLPLLLYRMGEFSLVSLPVNFLVVPFIPFTMFFGFLTSISAFFGTIISFPFATFTLLLTFYELSIVNIFSHLPFSSILIPHFSGSLMIFCYLLLLLFIGRSYHKGLLRD